ncbi:MAG: phospholipase D-like domain-containing protein [Verrucomicrobiota bacterium]|nr:phospholipase D-like domain-containing protein [Verrucomicrobiota bacterium]
MSKTRAKGKFGLPELEIMEWVAVALAVLGLVAVFCIFFIRRQILEYHLEHTYGVSDPAFFGSALALTNPVPVSGNKIEILQDGDAYFPAMLAAIRGAKKSVNFQAYIVYSDKTGWEFRDALIERAQAGVEVRVLLDGVGSGWSLDNSDVKKMKEAGCKFAYYHPLLSWRIDRTNRRSHRRALVVDGRVGFTGGVGFAEQWSGHAQDPDHWHDVQVRVEGPLVAMLQSAFESHWVKTYGETLSGPGQFPGLTAAGNIRAQVIASHSFSTAPVPLTEAIAFSAAEKRIWITNAYCTPSDDQVELLVKAVQRGVDVRFIVPGAHNDQPLTKSAGRAAYGDLLKGGVKIFEYEPTMIHTKGLVVDGMFSLIGSSNFDPRSSQINEELDMAVYDQDFGRRMEAMFESDQKKSKEYTLQQFKDRSLWERITEEAMLPFRSQL